MQTPALGRHFFQGENGTGPDILEALNLFLPFLPWGWESVLDQENRWCLLKAYWNVWALRKPSLQFWRKFLILPSKSLLPVFQWQKQPHCRPHLTVLLLFIFFSQCKIPYLAGTWKALLLSTLFASGPCCSHVMQIFCQIISWIVFVVMEINVKDLV